MPSRTTQIAAGAFVAVAATATADVTLTAVQDGTDVTIAVAGSLDLSTLSPTTQTTLKIAFRPDLPEFGRASGVLDTYGISAVAFGDAVGTVIASGSGSRFFFDANTLYLASGDDGSDINLTFTAENKALADYGWTPGDSQLIATLPSDTINFVVAPAPTSAAALLLTAGATLTRRRR